MRSHKKAAFGFLILSTSLVGWEEAGAAQAQVTVFHDFTLSEGHPFSNGLVRGDDGFYYGTTANGGSSAAGAVFRLASDGTLTILHSFDGTDGREPVGTLLKGVDGNFYGATKTGGANDSGSVFKIAPDGSFATLHSFSTAVTDGELPYAGLAQDAAGMLYGTTRLGGSAGAGTIYKISTAGVFSLLYSFNSRSQGTYPEAAPVVAADGTLYGTTTLGGYAFGYLCSGPGCGVVYRFSPAGVYRKLYSFHGWLDGAGPNELMMASDGKLYGTTSAAGNILACSYDLTPVGCGTVFEISTSGAFKVLHRFKNFSGEDGAGPSARLLEGTDGNLYGSTVEGGLSSTCIGGFGDDLGCGTLFQITTSGQFTHLYSFDSGAAGDAPSAPLERGDTANEYVGVTSSGTAFKLTVN